MTNPTTPFSWQMPTATDLVTDLPADFEVFGQAVATSMADLLGGTTGQVLAKASNTNMDFSWVALDDSNAIQNAIVDAKGDLVAASAADTPARLAVGANGTVLTADSAEATGLKWTGAWTAWTPTLGNITLGNGTVTARYQQIGKTVNFRFNLLFGTTTSVTSSAYFFLPVAPVYDGPCQIVVRDNGVAFYPSVAMLFSAAGGFCDLTIGAAGGTYVTQTAVGATVPVTLGNLDQIYVSGSYEVA